MSRNLNLLLALALALGCNRRLEYPYPVTKAHVEGLVVIAEEAVKHCDVLLENDDCYQGESFSDLDDPAVPMPKKPLNGDPLLKYLWLECKRGDDKIGTCKSRKYDTGAPHGSGVDCKKEVLWTRGNVTAPDRGNFEQLFRSVAPTCAGPWNNVFIARTSPRGHSLELHALFVAPEAEKPGGPVFRLKKIAADLANDADLLCSQEGFDLCLAPDVDPSQCRKLDLRSAKSKGLSESLANEADPPRRAALVQQFLSRVLHVLPCPLEHIVRSDPREAWRLKVEQAERRGPPTVILDPTTQGPLTPTEVTTSLNAALPGLTHCFDAARTRVGNGRVGNLLLTLHVPPAGAPLKIEDGPMNNPKLNAPKKDTQLFPCAAAALRGHKLPRRTQSSIVSLLITDMP